MQVISNGRTRTLLSWADLTENEKEKLLLNIDGVATYLYAAKYVRFQSRLHAIDDNWISAVGILEGWDRMLPQSASSGLALRLETRDSVIVGRYFI